MELISQEVKMPRCVFFGSGSSCKGQLLSIA